MEPFVWMFGKDFRNGRRRAPINAFEETDFYTIQQPGGGRDLVLEKGLQELESRFAQLRDGKLASEEPVSAEEGAYLFAFIIAMSFRTKGHRERRRRQWQHVLEEMERATSLKDDRDRSPQVRFSFSQNRNDPSLSLDDVRRIVEFPTQHLMAGEIATYLPLVAGMHMMVLRTEDPVGFVTSDDPCIWINDQLNDGPPLVKDLGDFGILMPLSPRQLLFMNPSMSCYGRSTSIEYVTILNAMSVQHASEHVVVCRNEIRREWLERDVQR